jgi:hypothetical protein
MFGLDVSTIALIAVAIFGGGYFLMRNKDKIAETFSAEKIKVGDDLGSLKDAVKGLKIVQGVENIQTDLERTVAFAGVVFIQRRLLGIVADDQKAIVEDSCTKLLAAICATPPEDSPVQSRR